MPSGAHKNKPTKWTKQTRPKSPGRPKGAKDKVPRTWKGTIKSIFEEVASEDPGLIKTAIVKGLKASAPKSFQYLQIMTYYIDGKPTEAVPVGDVRRAFRAMTELVLQIVPDPQQRRLFIEGVRGIIGAGAHAVIDAQPQPQDSDD